MTNINYVLKDLIFRKNIRENSDIDIGRILTQKNRFLYFMHYICKIISLCYTL